MAMRRGACPTLAAPMRTGDGWLARLTVAEMTAAQLGGLAAVAARLGNGIIEVTARGSLQVRGLAEGAGPALAEALGGLGIEVVVGLPAVTGALAGVDPDELADPRPVATALRARVAGLALLPKVTVVVDGGGVLTLDAVAADLRLVAVPEGWRLDVADRPVAVHDADGVVAAAADLLGTMAERRLRGRDFRVEATLSPARESVAPVGPLPGGFGFGLPFGQAEAAMLVGLAAAAGAARFRPSAGRALVAVGADRGLVAAAARLGFVTEPDDPRRAVVACPGAPACGSGLLATRAMAGEVARVAKDLLEPRGQLHLSGCEKRCAQPVGRAVTVVGTAEGWEMTGEGMAVPPGLQTLLAGTIGRMVR